MDLDQGEQVIGAPVGVGGDLDGIDPIRQQPIAQEAADQIADAQLRVAEHVRDHIPDPPTRRIEGSVTTYAG